MELGLRGALREEVLEVLNLGGSQVVSDGVHMLSPVVLVCDFHGID
jgi:hypothetical protein